MHDQPMGAVTGAGVVAAGDGQLEAVIVTVVATVVILALLAVLWSLVRTSRALQEAADDLRREGLAVIGDMRSAVGLANTELERADTLLEAAESISTTADSASRLAYMAVSNPVIKVMAFGTGTARATRRLARRRA
jgi:hypothetical protein